MDSIISGLGNVASQGYGASARNDTTASIDRYTDNALCDQSLREEMKRIIDARFMEQLSPGAGLVPIPNGENGPRNKALSDLLIAYIRQCPNQVAGIGTFNRVLSGLTHGQIEVCLPWLTGGGKAKKAKGRKAA